MTRRALLDDAVGRLEEAGVENARRNAEWLLEDVLGVNRARLLAHPEAAVPPEAAERFERMLVRRLAREPLQYVLGHADFFGLRLRVGPAVLIPRPETEELVEEALRRLAGTERPWVLDVGTGSGAIALAIKYARPDAEVFACDVCADALAVAAANAERLALTVQLICADALAPAFTEGVPACFDLLVSNPPYVPIAEREVLAPEVRDYEPGVALFTSADALMFYRALAGHAHRVLKPGGVLLVETHADYGAKVEALFAASGLTSAGHRRDLAGRERIAWARRPG